MHQLRGDEVARVPPRQWKQLHDIETDEIYMFLDNVSLRDNAVGRSQFKVELRPIDAEFDLIAYMPETS